MIKAFDVYKVWYYSRRSPQGHKPGPEAIIHCIIGGRGLNYAGLIIFYKRNLPANYYNTPGRYAVLHYELDRFNDIISMLRQEKPLYIFFDHETRVGGVGNSELEPVGEEES